MIKITMRDEVTYKNKQEAFAEDEFLYVAIMLFSKDNVKRF